MKIFTTGLCLGAASLLVTSFTASADTHKVGILIGQESVENCNPQESAAARWFTQTYSDGTVITPSQTDMIDATKLDAIWIHIDRVGIGKGFNNLPEEFNNETVMNALRNYVKDGGNLYLSKFATQMIHELGRIPAEYAPGIFGDGNGGPGTDVWCVNAFLGSMQLGLPEPDYNQVYDRTVHTIYTDMESFQANSEWGNFPHPSYPMLGTGTGDEIHREDHNCMWDLNSYTWTAEGRNTLEKFESQFDCTVIGTWGHVQDYCVAGIVEFEPTSDIKGRIIANGLAACEWAPRSGINAYHTNLTKLTANTLNYLAPGTSSGITETESDTTEAEYYTLQGVRTSAPAAGLHIVVKNGKASKVMFK